MSFFAVIWWLAGTLNSGWSPFVVFGIPAAVLTYLFIIGKKGSTPPAERSEEEEHRIGRLVGIASGVEGIMIFAAINILSNIGKSDLLPAVIAIIVGLHFLPLARWIPAKLYYLTAIILVLLGILGFFISDADLRLKIVCIGSAWTLWITSYILLRMLTLFQKNEQVPLNLNKKS
jgi:hypothetical protein